MAACLDWLLVYGVLVSTLVVLLTSSIRLNDGNFTYTLDDPYIHLAVSEEIFKGNYGVNSGEFSAPASSIIWPLLLAPLSQTAIAHLVPLAINLSCVVLIAAIILRRLRIVFPNGSYATCIARVAITFIILIAANIPSLIFLGMEHCLQTLLALIIVDGLIGIARNEPTSRVLLVALALGPLVRYENLALSLVGCVILWRYTRTWKALIPLGISALALLLFSSYLVANGQSPFPTSVLVKSHQSVGVDATLASRLTTGLFKNVGNAHGSLLALASVALIASALIRRSLDFQSLATLGVAACSLAHLVVGSFDEYDRYHAYILSSAFFAFACLPMAALYAIFRWRLALLMLPILILLCYELATPYLVKTSRIPLASNNIYEQQYQMHRFITEFWKRPTAVNDLGWTSYRNDQYVLDLWGLASLDAFKARVPWQGSDWMTSMTQAREAELAIIYSGWFPDLPDNWQQVGEMHLSRERESPAASSVQFYATSPDAREQIHQLLESFSATLPDGVALHLSQSPESDLTNTPELEATEP